MDGWRHYGGESQDQGETNTGTKAGKIADHLILVLSKSHFQVSD